ncbi:MAG: VOC family protein [Capsulimonadaceae bacterium]|nr:VOC family protein [Capsulimonadaceae bacterium]
MMTKLVTNDVSIGPVNLTVSDLSRASAFYRDTVGLRHFAHDEGSETLTANGQTPLLRLTEDARASQRGASDPRMRHFALLVPERLDLARSVRHMLNMGRPIVRASDHYVCESVYFKDPDCNEIEISADRPRSLWFYSDDQLRLGSCPLGISALVSEAGLRDDTWNGMPVDTKIGHVDLQVMSLSSSTHFYCDLIGFDLSVEMPGAVYVANGGYHHHFGLCTWTSPGAEPVDVDAIGLRSATIEFATDKILRQVVENLRSELYPVVEGSASLATVDPSGHKINLAVRQGLS